MTMGTAMRATALVFAVALGGAIASGQEREKKVRPQGSAAVEDSMTKHSPGDKVERSVVKEVVQGGKKAYTRTKTTVVIPPRTWMLGTTGWFDNEGFNVEQLVNVRVGANTFPSSLGSARGFLNGRPAVFALEPGDVITRVDGQPVTTDLELFLAIHFAPDPRKLSLEWIDWRSGRTFYGTVSAIKLRP